MKSLDEPRGSLTDDQLDQLVSLLWDCRSMQERHERTMILQRLAPDIVRQIPDSDSPGAHIRGIVTICDQNDALPALVEAVRRFEGPSRNIHDLDTFMAELASTPD